MKVSTLAFSVLAATAVADYLDANRWTTNDIKQFLHDRKVEFDKHTNEKELIAKANSELDKLKNFDTIVIDVNDDSNQKIIDLATNPNANLNDQLPYHNWDYLFIETEDGNGGRTEEWIFESWSVDSLKKFAKQNKIKVDKIPTKQDLIDAIKKGYNKIAEANHASGLYPGDWLYSTWSVDDLKKWLKSFDIEFDPKATKDNLIDLVKQHNYFASTSQKDSKQSLLDSLNLLEKDIFDSAGKIKAEVFDTWSYSQLREWLYYNGIIDTKPDVYQEDLTPAKVKQIARTYEGYLSSDIKHWYENAKKTASPFVGKGSGNNWLSNETFSVGINKWSKERLQDFLKARDVKFSRFSTKKHLVDLVQKHKNTPVVENTSFNWLVGGLSTDSFKNWLQEQGQNIEGSRQDLINTIQGYVGNAKPQSFKAQSKFYKPDLQQYRDYLVNNAKISKQKVDKMNDEAIEATYKIASDYYDEASRAIESEYDSAKSSVDDTLQEIQDSAYEYSAQFVEDYENNKEKVNSQIEQTKKAAGEWSQYFLNSFNDVIENNAKPAASAAVQDTNNYFWGLFAKLQNVVLQQKPVVDEKLNEYSSSFNEQYDAGKKNAEQAAANLKVKAGEAASVVGEKADEYGKAAQAKGHEYAAEAQKQAEEARKGAHAKGQEFAAEASQQAEEIRKAAQAKGEEYAAEASKQAEEMRKAAYAKGQEFASQAGVKGEELRKLAQAKGEEYAAEAAIKAEEMKKVAYAKGQEYASEASIKADELLKAAQAKGQQYAEDAQKAAASAYSEYKPVVDREAAKAYEGAKSAAKSAGDKAANDAKGAAKIVAASAYETMQSGWNYLLDSFANVDLITYLQSFGFDHAWLAKLNRRQLKILAHEQTKVFYGEKPAWDKSIKDVLVETSGDLQKRLGYKQESYWDKVKGFF